MDNGAAEPEQLTVEDVCESSYSEATPTSREVTPPLGDNELHNTSLLEVSGLLHPLHTHTHTHTHTLAGSD